MKKYLIVLFVLLSMGLNAKKYYLSPAGSDAGAGTITAPFFTLNKAWTVVSAGDTVYMHGGTYAYTSQQVMTGKSGTSANRIKVWAIPGEIPVIKKGSSYAYNNDYGYGCYFSGNYVHFKGIDISYFTQETEHVWHGLRAYGNNNIFEKLNIHHNGAGMLLGEGSTGNLILNCDFHHNNDPLSPIPYNNGSGLSTSRNTNTSANNVVRGCRAWWNTDTGFDAYYNEGFVTWDSCWSFWNGYLPDTFTPTRPDEPFEGCGWKFGETEHEYPGIYKRLITRCIANRNKSIGYTVNGGFFIVKVYNCVSFNNGWIGFELNNGCANTLRNNISFGDKSYACSLGSNAGRVVDHNTFMAIEVQNPDYTVNEADFVSIAESQLDDQRQSNGNLPVITFLTPAAGSDLIDTGIDVGLVYNGSSPDLGYYETGTTVVVPPPPAENHAPDAGNQNFTLPAGYANGTAAGTVIASDPDGDALSFKITSGNSYTSFKIVKSTGLITVNNASYIRSRIKKYFDLGILISDNRLPALTKSITVRIYK